MKTTFLLLSVALLAGCATKIRVDYMTDPAGATLYQDGQPVGTAPVSLFYEPEATFKSGGCQQAKGTSVQWASGAKAEISYLTLCSNLGWQQHYWFRRPDVPGREIDMNYALQLQRNGIMRQQAAAAETAATVQLKNTLNPPLLPPSQVPRQINCTSYRTGNQVQTDCN